MLPWANSSQAFTSEACFVAQYHIYIALSLRNVKEIMSCPQIPGVNGPLSDCGLSL